MTSKKRFGNHDPDNNSNLGLFKRNFYCSGIGAIVGILVKTQEVDTFLRIFFVGMGYLISNKPFYFGADLCRDLYPGNFFDEFLQIFLQL